MIKWYVLSTIHLFIIISFIIIIIIFITFFFVTSQRPVVESCFLLLYILGGFVDRFTRVHIVKARPIN